MVAPSSPLAALDHHPYHVVQLHPCDRPTGLLESAPRTSLRSDSATEKWEGFWCVADDDYYTRCIREDGSEQWYCFVEERSREAVAEARILPLRVRKREYPVTHRMLLVWPADGRRAILVGARKRATRVRPLGTAGGGR